jgi:uncharacterized repeat protein (TIGR03803 family)
MTLSVTFTLAMQAQTLTTLYNFAGSPDGSGPAAPLVRDLAGNLYGTTVAGGTNNGTVFKIDTQGKETVLYTFAGGADGSGTWAGLVRDSQGNLYGTTAYGGAFNFGTVFKVSKTGVHTILYNFKGSPDGAIPFAGLVRDSSGNFYGTTTHGGTGSCVDYGGNGCGTVFMLSANGTETVLHNFIGGADGQLPVAGLLRDSSGNLYGTTVEGGSATCSDFSVSGCGTVFSLSNTGVESVLHSFAGYPTDGEGPRGTVIKDGKGNLYSTTQMGGAFGNGTVFKITRSGVETLLYSFSGGNDAKNPDAGLIRDASTNLYGTTQAGGGTGCNGNGCGTVFKVTSKGAETILHAFTDTNGGQIPMAAVILDSAGNMYGTTANGGTYAGPGTVFKLQP